MWAEGEEKQQTSGKASAMVHDIATKEFKNNFYLDNFIIVTMVFSPLVQLDTAMNNDEEPASVLDGVSRTNDTLCRMTSWNQCVCVCVCVCVCLRQRKTEVISADSPAPEITGERSKNPCGHQRN